MVEADDSVQRELYKKEFIRDVKKHIQDIAKKYILVGEGTIDYALMYVPSEAVYYEVINSTELCDFANQKRVLPVSPMGFYAYLKAILVSFEGQRIQSQAKEILLSLQAMKKDYEKTEEAFSTLNKHITNAYNQTNQVSKSLIILGQKIHSTNSLSTPVIQEKLLDEA
jgi:DNA recombination protein RmuC